MLELRTTAVGAADRIEHTSESTPIVFASGTDADPLHGVTGSETRPMGLRFTSCGLRLAPPERYPHDWE
jgi:hypothetical protein